MITSGDIQKLAQLSRINIAAGEQESLCAEIDAILGYVDQIKKATQVSISIAKTETLFNVMREDTDPHDSGEFTEKILNSAPEREENYLKVKKIL